MFPCRPSVLLVLCVAQLACASFFTDTDNVTAVVGRYGASSYFSMPDGSSVEFLAPRERVLLSVCNVNLPCDERLSSQSPCDVVTPSCNCMIWEGRINVGQTHGGRVSLIETRKRCLEILVENTTTVTVDWHLQRVGSRVPRTLLHVGYALWKNSVFRYSVAFIPYFFRFVYPSVCTPLELGPICRSKTTLTFVLKHHKPRPVTDATVWIVAGLGVLALFLVRELHTFQTRHENKKQE